MTRLLRIFSFPIVVPSFTNRFLSVLDGRLRAAVQATQALRAVVGPDGVAVIEPDVVSWAVFDADAAADAFVGVVEWFAAHLKLAEKRVDYARFQKLLALLQIAVDGRVRLNGRHNSVERADGFALFFLLKFSGVGVEARENHVGVGHLHRIDVAALPALAAEQFQQHSVCQAAVVAASQNAVNQIVAVVFDFHSADEFAHNPRNSPRVDGKHKSQSFAFCQTERQTVAAYHGISHIHKAIIAKACRN